MSEAELLVEMIDDTEGLLRVDQHSGQFVDH